MDADKKFLVDMGIRILKRRKEIKLTQEQLAEKVGISLQSISCIELGKKAIRPYNLVKLCDALGVSTDYILTGKISENHINDFMKKITELSKDDLSVLEMLINYMNNKK